MQLWKQALVSPLLMISSPDEQRNNSTDDTAIAAFSKVDLVRLGIRILNKQNAVQEEEEEEVVEEVEGAEADSGLAELLLDQQKS